MYLTGFKSTILLALSFLALSCSEEDANNGGKQGGGGPRAISVEGYVTKPEAVAQYLTATGTFIANEAVEVSPETSGILEQIYFSEGDRVGRGQLLARLDRAPILADLEKLSVEIKLAETEAVRGDTLYRIEAISKEEYDRLVNRVESLKAQKKILEVQLAKTDIRAPFPGVLGLRQVSTGAFLQMGQPIVTLRQLHPLKLEFSVPEKYSSSLAAGDSVSFTIPSSDRRFEAKVYVLDPSINLQTRSRKIRAMADNRELQFFPGGFADVRYSVASSKNALMVPAEAVIQDLEGQKLFVTEDGSAVIRRVQLGIRTNKMVQVSEGIEAGDTVLLTGLLQLVDGMPVKVTAVDPIETEMQ